VEDGDGATEAEVLAAKLAGLRIFADDEGRMNRSVGEAGGSVLLISQFTLAADVRKGRRPSFTRAADPEVAEPLIELMAERIRSLGLTCATGRFGSVMAVALVNDGPVTIVIDVRDGRVR
jgi:D-tyrosyl-tRNA(Tyr) deacylase